MYKLEAIFKDTQAKSGLAWNEIDLDKMFINFITRELLCDITRMKVTKIN